MFIYTTLYNDLTCQAPENASTAQETYQLRKMPSFSHNPSKTPHMLSTYNSQPVVHLHKGPLPQAQPHQHIVALAVHNDHHTHGHHQA